MAATAANSSSEVTRNTTMAAAAAYMSGANFASGGSGLLDSTVCLSLHLFSPCIKLFYVFWFETLNLASTDTIFSSKNHAPVSD
jgi:hypothetical protein